MSGQQQMGGNQQTMMQPQISQQSDQQAMMEQMMARQNATSGNPMTEPQPLEGA